MAPRPAASAPLGNLQMKTLGPHSRPMNQKPVGRNPELCILTHPPSDSDEILVRNAGVGKCSRITNRPINTFTINLNETSQQSCMLTPRLGRVEYNHGEFAR